MLTRPRRPALRAAAPPGTHTHSVGNILALVLIIVKLMLPVLMFVELVCLPACLLVCLCCSDCRQHPSASANVSGASLPRHRPRHQRAVGDGSRLAVAPRCRRAPRDGRAQGGALCVGSLNFEGLLGFGFKGLPVCGGGGAVWVATRVGYLCARLLHM